jgi:putative two-component system response regulator
MRLLAVADVYEALTSERPYRAAMRSEEALELIRVAAPHALDSAAAAALVADPGAPGVRPRHLDDDETERVEGVLDRRA